MKTENRKKDAEIKQLKDETNQLNIKIDDPIKANDKKEKSCQVCEKTCKTNSNLKSYISTDHRMKSTISQWIAK